MDVYNGRLYPERFDCCSGVLERMGPSHSLFSRMVLVIWNIPKISLLRDVPVFITGGLEGPCPPFGIYGIKEGKRLDRRGSTRGLERRNPISKALGDGGSYPWG